MRDSGSRGRARSGSLAGRRGDARELAAEHREHLGADQVELLMDRRLRQTREVDGEQLALVVAEVLALREHLLDDLGRAADVEAGRGDRLLERAAAAQQR